jgi:hypothetical protein
MNAAAAIASQPLAYAGLRDLVTELSGPRPAGTSNDALNRIGLDARTSRATRP